MVVADAKQSLTITGNGDVLEPHDGIIGTKVAIPCIRKQSALTFAGSAVLHTFSNNCHCVTAIGSGGSYALAASRALIDLPDLTAMEIAKKAMTIAADTCIYTNHNFTTETLDSDQQLED